MCIIRQSILNISHFVYARRGFRVYFINDTLCAAPCAMRDFSADDWWRVAWRQCARETCSILSSVFCLFNCVTRSLRECVCATKCEHWIREYSFPYMRRRMAGNLIFDNYKSSCQLFGAFCMNEIQISRVLLENPCHRITANPPEIPIQMYAVF